MKLFVFISALVFAYVAPGVSQSQAAELSKRQQAQVLKVLLSSNAKMIAETEPEFIQGKNLIGLIAENLITEPSGDYRQVNVYCEKTKIKNERDCSVSFSMIFEGEDGERFESSMGFMFILQNGKQIKGNTVKVGFAG